MLILAIVAVAFMVFGSVEGLIGGSLLLWYLATILVSSIYSLGRELVSTIRPEMGPDYCFCSGVGADCAGIDREVMDADVWYPLI